MIRYTLYITCYALRVTHYALRVTWSKFNLRSKF